MLGQKHDLPDVRGVMGDLAVDGLQHGMRLAADRDRSHHVVRPEIRDRAEDALPALLPQLHHLGASRRCCDLELGIAKAIRLFSVGGKKVGEARAHVPCQMFHQDRHRIRFGIEHSAKVRILKLRHRTFAHALVAAHLAPRFVEIVCREISFQESPQPSPAAATRSFNPNALARAQSRAELPRHLFDCSAAACDKCFSQCTIRTT